MVSATVFCEYNLVNQCCCVYSLFASEVFEPRTVEGNFQYVSDGVWQRGLCMMSL